MLLRLPEPGLAFARTKSWDIDKPCRRQPAARSRPPLLLTNS